MENSQNKGWRWRSTKVTANPSTICWMSLFLFYCVIKGQYFVQNKLFEGKRGCILFYPFFLFIYIYFPTYEITFPWPGLSMFLALSILFCFLNSVAALGKRICLFVRLSVDIKSKLQPNKHLNDVLACYCCATYGHNYTCLVFNTLYFIPFL